MPAEKGTPTWHQREKIINSTPALRKLRDQSQGDTKSNGTSHKPVSDAYREGWNRIFGDKKGEE